MGRHERKQNLAARKECTATQKEVNMASSSTGEGTSNMSQSQVTQRMWEMANNMEYYNAADEIYQYDRKQQQDILQAKPWEKDPHFFKQIKISALALLKMVMHA